MTDHQVGADIRQVRILPFILVLILALGVLKSADIWVTVSGADASPIFPDRKRDAENAASSAAVGDSAQSDTAESLSIRTEAAPTAPDALPGVYDARQFESSVEKKLLERLRDRRQQLDERESALDAREALLQTAEAEIDEKIRQLSARRAELAAIENRLEQRQTDELDSLVKAYERMKPRDAARIFNLLEDDLLISVASSLRTQALAGILAEMEPARAERLTARLATSTSGGSGQDLADRVLVVEPR